MRLAEIRSDFDRLSTSVQPLVDGDISDQVHNRFSIRRHDGLKRRLMRQASVWAAPHTSRRAQRRVGLQLSFEYDHMFIGERFADDCSLSALISLLPQTLDDVLLPGCYIGGEDAQFWLRRGVRHLAGCDVYSLKSKWDKNVPQLERTFGAKVDFRQGSVEDLPYEDESFDLIATTAVLEHVRNIEAMSGETARVLRPGGICWHTFGPLYYSYGADHCISAYGNEHGYDHLLLSEDEYQSLIGDQEFFDTQADSNLPFWARNAQFSFATAQHYLEVMGRDFDVEHLVVKISSDGLIYRQQYPENWMRLLDAGVREEDLLIKSLAITMRRRT